MRYLLKVTREIYRCYMSPTGEVYDKPIGSIGMRNLGKEKDDFLKKYINTVMNTKIVSNTSKIYIRSSLPSVNSVFVHYNAGLDESRKINIKTAQSQIDYDSKKMLQFFPDDMLSKIIYYGECELENYKNMLNLVIAKYEKRNKLLDNLALKIPRVEVQECLEEDEFNELLSIIKLYIKSHMQYIENNLDHKACGYLLYLMSSPCLEGENKERYEYLKQLLE